MSRSAQPSSSESESPVVNDFVAAMLTGLRRFRLRLIEIISVFVFFLCLKIVIIRIVLSNSCSLLLYWLSKLGTRCLDTCTGLD